VRLLFKGTRKVKPWMVQQWRQRLRAGEGRLAISKDYPDVSLYALQLYTSDIEIAGRGPGRQYDYDRDRMVALLDEGVQQKEIAFQMGCTQQLVSYVWKQIQLERNDGCISYREHCRRLRRFRGDGPGRSGGRGGGPAQLRVIKGGRE
jgi:hypothetical protein